LTGILKFLTFTKRVKIKQYETPFLSTNEYEYMNYPLRYVSMIEAEEEMQYVFTYLPEGYVYYRDGLEEMVTVVYNCMGRKLKTLNYGESKLGIYTDAVEEIYEMAKGTSTNYYYSSVLLETWSTEE